MQILFTPTHRLHKPPSEFHSGVEVPHGDRPARVDVVFDRLQARYRSITYKESDDSCIRRVHGRNYLEFLSSIKDSTYYFSHDFNRDPVHSPMTPYSQQTIQAAYAAANLAAKASNFALNYGTCFALTRPPGHHAGYEYSQGICYLNNGIIAAQEALRNETSVAILDLDLHYGGGLQELAGMNQIRCASLHESPSERQSVFRSYGHQHESDQNILNLPLKDGIGTKLYLAALEEALDFLLPIDMLVVCAGFDTSPLDSHSRLNLNRAIYHEIGSRLAATECLKTILLEGGYYDPIELAQDVNSFLDPLSDIYWDRTIRVSILYHSETGNTRAAAELVHQGCINVDSTEARCMSIDALDLQYIRKSHAIIFGCPTYYAGPSWQMKRFIDTFEETSISIEGKLGACFSTCNWLGGGGEIALQAMHEALFCYGMILYSGGIYSGRPYNHLGSVCLRLPEGCDNRKAQKLGRDVALKAHSLFAARLIPKAR